MSLFSWFSRKPSPPKPHPAGEAQGVLGADGVRGDDRTLDQHVRVGHHQRNVFAGTGFRLVGVDHEILGFGIVLVDERPLLAGGEARTTATTQDRLFSRCSMSC